MGVFYLSACVLLCIISQSEEQHRIVPGHLHPVLNPAKTGHRTESILHASAPRELAVYPAPLPNSDHELMFNISWGLPSGVPPTDYSIEIHSVTQTSDCSTQMCYEPNIPGTARWWMLPQQASPLPTGCAVRPGCAYEIRIIAHPWDGHAVSTLSVELDECVAGVCSCGHWPRLPTPTVKAQTFRTKEELYVNVTWSLPPPSEPLRLPPALNKGSYSISLGKQMVSDAHPSPWYKIDLSRRVASAGPVAAGDSPRWLLLPLSRRARRQDARLLARVSLVDERNCAGPAGNATVQDPAEPPQTPHVSYAVWAGIVGAILLAGLAVAAAGARGAKRLLLVLKPAPAPLEPLRRRPAWLPLQPTNVVKACIVLFSRKISARK